MRFTTCFLILSAAMLTSRAWAVQHVVPGAYPHAFQDMIHHPSAAQVRAAGSYQAATINFSTGTKNVAVIIVGFSAGGSGLTSGTNFIKDARTIKIYFDQMKAYYQEVSYGDGVSKGLILNFKYFNFDKHLPDGDDAPSLGNSGVYLLANPMEYYGCGDEGPGCPGITTPIPVVGANGNYLIRDAIIAARKSGHTNLISTDKGGSYDAIIVVHAGNGNETTQGTNGDIWSIFYSDDKDIIGGQSGSKQDAIDAGFSEGDVVPETEVGNSPFGVMCHEFGHSLGLPDLYNTSGGGTSVVGYWELMDAGPYLNNGANPAHMGIWDKIFLGWVTPVVANSQADITLAKVENSPSGLKIPIINGLPKESFLVEYRSPNGVQKFDKYIPGEGLLIWHVDETIALERGVKGQNTVNTGTPHYGVSIVSADGSSTPDNKGVAGNVFGNGKNFTHPQSANFAGQPSGINLLDIRGIGTETATMNVDNFHVSESQSIAKLINYPNPAGKGYPHPRGEGHTTIQLQLAKPPSDWQINIYTLSGDLVRKVAQSEIRPPPSSRKTDTDFKFVYEFDWDLKNGDGAMVAPGVYIYLARVDGVSKSNKAVIIR